MAYKGHYGEYSGNAKHSRKTNTWEEEDVKRGIREEEAGHKGHAEALFDDAHGSYNYDGSNSTGAEHGTSRRSSSPLNDEGHGGKPDHAHNTFSLSELDAITNKEAARSKAQAAQLYNPEGQGSINYESEDEQTYAGGEVGADYDEEGLGEPKKMTMTRHMTKKKPRRAGGIQGA